jgi:hypothetical protein
LILLGSLKPWASDPAVYARLFERQAPRKDFELIGIKSPEALWARQLASQRTAFAISAPGPIQSDLFPILEYEAPRAFYIGAKAKDLARFDERTWQSELAPIEKQSALRSLDDKFLRPVFADYSTINEELRSHLLWRYQRGIGSTPEYRPTWPCLFKPNNLEATRMEGPSDVGDEVKKLLAATQDIESGGAARLQGIDAIIALLSSYSPTSDWSVPHYAGLAVKASIAIGDFDRARKGLSAALQMYPDHVELGYLQRVSERQQQILTASLEHRN